MKKLANLKGVKMLNKQEQKMINGGYVLCDGCVTGPWGLGCAPYGSPGCSID